MFFIAFAYDGMINFVACASSLFPKYIPEIASSLFCILFVIRPVRITFIFWAMPCILVYAAKLAANLPTLTVTCLPFGKGTSNSNAFFSIPYTNWSSTDFNLSYVLLSKPCILPPFLSVKSVRLTKSRATSNSGAISLICS